MTTERCWGYHATVIPADSSLIVDKADELWTRTGSRVWESGSGEQTKHETWLLANRGPVRCPVELAVGLPLSVRR